MHSLGRHRSTMDTIPSKAPGKENRASFMARLHFVPSVMLDVEWAYTAAKASHSWQTRKELGPDGQPLRYFEHIRRVSLVLIDEARCATPEMVCAALLHDSVEDTHLSLAMIEHMFGADVAGLVQKLSKVPKEGYLERLMLCTDWRPYLIKACDRLDNLRSLAGSSPEFQRKQLIETRDKYFPVFDRMLALTPDEYRDRVLVIRDKIRETTVAAWAVMEAQAVGGPVVLVTT